MEDQAELESPANRSAPGAARRGSAVRCHLLVGQAHEAIARVLEGRGWHRWEAGRKSLADHLCDVLDSLVANENRRASVRRERPMGDGDLDMKPDSRPGAEQQIEAIEERERERRLAARVLARVAADPLITGMLEHEKAGIGRAPELAALLHCTVKDIYRARERVAYHRDRVLEEERRAEEQMKNEALSS